MSERYNRYLEANIRWSKFTNDVAYWLFLWFLASFVGHLVFSYDECLVEQANLLAINSFSDSFHREFLGVICASEIGNKALGITWLIAIFVNILLHTRDIGLHTKITGLKPIRSDGEEWRVINAFSYVLIKWLPSLIGAVYLLTIGVPPNLYDAGAFNTISIGAQLIWIAPIGFKLNGKNITEVLTSVSIMPTEDKLKKIEASYESKTKRSLNHFAYGVEYITYVFFVGLFLFGFIQFLRVPEQSPAYQEALYGGYNPIWQDNTYFALAGLSAPEGFEDYYQYGLKKASDKSRTFEQMKRRMGVKEEYLREVPIFSELSHINTGKEIGLNDKNWKKLNCLYDLSVRKNEFCATFSDWESYIEQNKTIWNRYNQVTDIGGVVNIPQQLLGSMLGDVVKLAELKAVHILYLAENNKSEEAMEEWLSYMGLYRSMAENHETFVFKAMMALIVVKHQNALEALLYKAPELAKKYRIALLDALRVEGELFLDGKALAHDWGLVEPFSAGSIGNVNAIQNDFVECIEGYSKLVSTPANKFPFKKKNVRTCSLNEDPFSFQAIYIYPLLAPGSYIPSMIYNMLIRGVLKKQSLIGAVRITETKLKQAQVAVIVLSESTLSNEVSRFINSLGVKHQNPIEGAPFLWNEKEQALAFERPDGKRLSFFKLNLSDRDLGDE